MKRLVFFFTILFATVALPLSAATIKVGDEVTIKQDESVAGDLYITAGNIVISGGIDGDLVVGGGNILFNGSTTADVMIGGGAVDILGPVGDDIRAAGGQVRVGENVVGDVLAAGGLVHILPTVVVGGDVILSGGSVVIDGEIQGSVKVYAGDVQLNGTFIGDVVIFTSGRVEIGDESVFEGNFEYTAPHEVIIPESVTVAGETIFHEAEIVTDVRSFFQALFGAVFITKIFTLLTAALLLALLFQGFSTRLATEAIEHPVRELARGFVVFIILPVASLILILSLLGFLVGALSFVLFAWMIIFVKIASGIVFGAILSHLIQKKILVNWQWVIVGVTLLQVINLVPFVGWVVSSLVFLVTFGALSKLFFQTFWVNR